MNTIKATWQRSVIGKLTLIALALFLCCILVTCTSAILPDSDPTPSAEQPTRSESPTIDSDPQSSDTPPLADTPVASTEPANTPTPVPPTAEPTNTPIPAPTNTPKPKPTATKVPQVEQMGYSGTGDGIVDLTLPEGIPAVLAIRHNGSRNFIIESYDANNQQIDLVVNTIGNYVGVRPINHTSRKPARLVIQADGKWTIDQYDLRAGHRVEVPDNYQTTGDDVLLLMGETPDTATIQHNGSRNFIVMAYDGGIFPDLLINTIGAYNGTVLVPSSTIYLEIVADGDWSANVTGR